MHSSDEGEKEKKRLVRKKYTPLLTLLITSDKKKDF